MKNQTNLLGAFLLIFSGAAIGQTQLPHTFTAGQPARATEVNENFSELESAINQNASDIADNTSLVQANTAAIGANGRGVRVLAAGTSVGLFVILAPSRPGADGYRALSDMGYFFDVIATVNPALMVDRPSVAGDLSTRNVWFESAGCTGPAYTGTGNVIDPFQRLQGFVFRSDDPSDPIQTYYVPAGSQEVDRVLSYRRSFLEGGCVFIGTPTNTFVPVLPNDPAMTGVQDESFVGPILLGR